MKKTIAMTLVLTLALTLICGCTPAHTHAGGAWDRDAKQHWKLCECGEKLEAGEHTLDEDSNCTVCGSQVWNYGDTASVFNFDEHENFVRITDYDADGSVTGEDIREHTYDAEGNLTATKYYDQNGLYQEDTFVPDANGEPMTVKSVSYGIDARSEAEYDKNGNITTARIYDLENALIEESLYTNEYGVDEDGCPWLSRVTCNDTVSGLVTVEEFDSDDRLILTYTRDADGNEINHQSWEYDFDLDGRVLAQREYDNGVLVWEDAYTIRYDDDGDGWSHLSCHTEYLPEGGKIVTEYDENEEEISVITYDADGNVVE